MHKCSAQNTLFYQPNSLLVAFRYAFHGQNHNIMTDDSITYDFV